MVWLGRTAHRLLPKFFNLFFFLGQIKWILKTWLKREIPRRPLLGLQISCGQRRFPRATLEKTATCGPS